MWVRKVHSTRVQKQGKVVTPFTISLNHMAYMSKDHTMCHGEPKAIRCSQAAQIGKFYIRFTSVITSRRSSAVLML